MSKTTDTAAPLTFEQIRKQLPDHLFVKDEARFLISVIFSASLVITTAYLSFTYIPLNVYTIPLWILYAFVNGTFAIGLWVLGHECGHGAFSESQTKNDILGFLLHTINMVPYFSW